VVHYCKSCGLNFRGFEDALRHALRDHRDELDEGLVELYRRALERRWRCDDCVHAGTIYYDELDEYAPLQKACPGTYRFNHPNPTRCPNFWPREWTSA